MRPMLATLCGGLLMLSGMGAALAHKGSDAYLEVQQIGDVAPASYRDFRFVLAVAIKDLDLVLPVDANADGKVTWGEIRAVTPRVLPLLGELANIESPAKASPGGPGVTECHLIWQPDGVERRSDGTYLRVTAQARCPAAEVLAFRYTLFKDQDANHRLLVAGRVAGIDLLTTTSPQQPTPLVLGSAASPVAVGEGSTLAGAAAPPSSRWAALRDYFSLGVHHLLEGYDHLAFLLALVLPLRLNLRRRSSVLDLLPSGSTGFTAQPNVWVALLRTITAFTLGHSITLMLATFGWTQASPVWVEPVIALSIAVTALLNLRPVPWLRTDVLALLFGLVHGFGFAGLLQEAAAPTGLLPWALAGFNIGVEAGQLMAVSAWVLLSQWVVVRLWYDSLVVRGGSVLLVIVAAWWFWQRVG